MNVLKTRIDSHNSTIPLNVYRISGSNDQELLWNEVETCLTAYYNLIDECEEYPEWQTKLRFDLGGVVSFLALVVDESVRDAMVERSEVYKRFDMEK